MAANAQLLAPLRSGGDFDADATAEGGHGDFCAEDRLPRRKLDVMIKIVAFNAIIRVFGEAHAEKKIASRSAAGAAFAAAGQTELLSFAHAGRDLHLIIFHFVSLAAAVALGADA